MMPLLLPVFALWRREMVRFVRQRSRITGAFAQPSVFWLLLGGGLNASFQPAGAVPGTSFLAYFYPSTIALVLLFTAIFTTISTVEGCKEGFLQGVLVAPVPRCSIVLGQVLGGTSLAVLQGTLFLLMPPLLDIPLSVTAVVATVAVMAIVALALTSLGLIIAWRMESTQAFQAITNLILIPNPDSDLVALRRVLPSHRCAGAVALAHDDQPADVRDGRVAALPVPGPARRGWPRAGAGTVADHQRRVLRRGLSHRGAQCQPQRRVGGDSCPASNRLLAAPLALKGTRQCCGPRTES